MDVRVTSKDGRVEVITGCMFSGKTNELIRRSQKAQISGENVIGFKPDVDNRYEKEAISSHTGITIDAIPIGSDKEGIKQVMDQIEEYLTAVESNASGNRDTNMEYSYKTSNGIDLNKQIEFESNANQIDVVAIDEINLFDDQIVEFIRKLSDHNIRVIVSGLDLNFRGEPFLPTPDVLALADHVEKRQAVCDVCGDPATRTQRFIDDEPAPYDSPTIAVGGKEKYEPRCQSCHLVPNHTD